MNGDPATDAPVLAAMFAALKGAPVTPDIVERIQRRLETRMAARANAGGAESPVPGVPAKPDDR